MARLGLATRGMDAATKFRILRRHLEAVLRHATPRKIGNLLRVEQAMRRGDEVVNAMPYLLKIESTNHCNVRCAYCHDDRRQPREGERGYGNMDLELYRKVVDELAPWLFKINLYGFGEPFLYDATFDMIRHATDRNIGVGVSSNMNSRRDDLAARIVDSGLEVLIFSCHGATQASYERFMARGNMELALANVRALAAEKRRRGVSLPVIDWQYCVTGFNEGEIDQARALADELGVDQVRFIAPYFPEDAPAEWWSGRFPKAQAEQRDQAARRDVQCAWLYRTAFVNFDGGVSPCCLDVRPLANDFGDLRTHAFRDIWNNDHYRAARRLLRETRQGSATPPSGPATLCGRCPMVTGKGR